MSSALYKTIVIDDEPLARQRLVDLLSNFPSTFHVVAEAANGSEAIRLIHDLSPDLIFLDVFMPGMSGFEMLQHLRKIPMVIFCTAYDQFTLQAFETNSVDYLLKPVKLERLEQTVTKLKLFTSQGSQEKILDLIKNISGRQANKPLTSITIRKGTKLVLIRLEDVAYFEAKDKYVSVYSQRGEEHISEHTLAELEERLPEYFLRVHRAIIVNTNLVKELQSYFNSRFSITLNDSKQTNIISGRSFQTKIKDWINVK